MKWLIASDLHGSGYYCRALLDAFDREKADRLLLLGDLLYHGPRNDLPRDYDPKSVTAMLNERQASILAVRGNCDAEIDQAVLQFPILADYALLSVGSRLLFVTHGHLFHLDALPPLHPGDILLHGHTHVPACETRDGVTYLNPGSLAIPKEDSPHSYMTLEDGVFLWKDLLTGAVYREYRG
ncbi:MAG: phosphodiesterase [Clostridia bacterium]|nr:phosphodiesterase [Clostridia bacterium]MBQ3486967.1 phosphodiesterase [Clostridia bacterium]MBQ3652324.1 phosphodiesterase [Clostridia bacterium]MBQ6865675.1 phosphodiesterase [Clostridia bacterium]MBQ9323271.1 phosphodiesterase [Clostridia bacterium]